MLVRFHRTKNDGISRLAICGDDFFSDIHYIFFIVPLITQVIIGSHLRVNNTGIRYDFSTESVPIMYLYCLTVSNSVRNSTFSRSISAHLPVMSLNPSIPEITTVTWFSDKGPHFAQNLLHLLNIPLRFLCLFVCPQHAYGYLDQII